jgi:hypothetical protein
MKPLDEYCLQPIFTRDEKRMAVGYTGGMVKIYELGP